ncbi:MAG: hypothetical protein Q8Q49_06630, partial [bacterium]|nr:hypothetical protein [bacterium]
MKKITILLFTAIILALALGFAYQTQIGGDAKTIIQEHGQFFLNNTIPSADTIDIENDPWVQVAKLRSNIGYIGFFTGILFTIAVTSILVFGGISKQLSDFTKRKTERKFFQ